jgi:hypothetical protein
MNIRAQTKVKFNILNLTKSESLFKKGMQPYIFSKKLFEHQGIGWHRAGTNITYEQNKRTLRSTPKVMDIKFTEGAKANEVQANYYQQLYTLSFEYQYSYDYDVVYFAHSMPYTYTDLQNYLCKLHSTKIIGDRCRVEHLCDSLGK